MNFAATNRAAMGGYTSYASRSVNPPGFAGSLTPEQRSRMLAVLNPTQRSAYDAMSPTDKATFESDFADAHWDVISGTSTTAAQSAQTQQYLGATEQALGLTFGTISTAMANNNQQVLAQIRSDGDARIAMIQSQLTRDLAPTEATRLRYQLESLQNTQALIAQHDQQTAQTFSYIGAAAVLLALGGLYVWSQQARKNPVVERSGHRMFIPLELLPKGEQAEWRRHHPRKHAA